MLVSVHQPQYMPWLGYFDKMDRADCFVLLDTVQYKKNEWQNRNRIKAAQGPQWLTVPVCFRFPARLEEVVTNPAVNWRHKHWQAMLTNYRRAPCWEASAPSLEALYRQEYPRLVDINASSLEWLRGRLGIGTELRWASQLGAEEVEEPTQRLVEICQRLGATAYLAGAQGREYMDVEQFSAAGIEVIFQAFEHPRYPQLFGEFASHLSALDLVLNCGADSLAVLRSGRG